jgi:hypothetical protein
MCQLFLYAIFSIFQRPIGIVALSLNHMWRNLGRALLSVFSSVSVEIALWHHVFLGSYGFSCRKSCFSKNLCYGTLYCLWMSINVNVFLELVGLVSFTDRVQCSDRNWAISMSYYAFSMPKSANPDWMANWHISIVQSLGYLCMQWRHQWTWTSLPKFGGPSWISGGRSGVSVEIGIARTTGLGRGLNMEWDDGRRW